MSEPARSIDFVAALREVRDRLNDEIADLSYEELVERLRKRASTDPLLERRGKRAPHGPTRAGGDGR